VSFAGESTSPWGEPAPPVAPPHTRPAGGPLRAPAVAPTSSQLSAPTTPLAPGARRGSSTQKTGPSGAQAPAPVGTPRPARTTALPSPTRAAAASVLAATATTNGKNRKHQLVERTVLVRVIPRTGMFARARSVIALTIIAVSIGVVLAGTLSVVIWGLAAAIHRAASN